MKPRILKISGLNSFEEEQIIHFDKLIEKGLFGIFGPTGSGKSTILDAITIALYGNVTRTNKGYINTSTKNLTVSYEFEIGNGTERRTYIAERNLKINKTGGYNTKYARLIKKEEGRERVIAEGPNELQNEIEKIIGLTGEDFTRSVVLPQGKFNEFLKLKGKDKRDMLERIFNLEKYGKILGDRIKKVKSIYIKEENILTGELKKYEGITEEDFKDKEEELKGVIKEEKLLQEEKKKLDEDYEKYKDIWELQRELKIFKQKEEKLSNRIEDINEEKEKLKKAEGALKVKPSIDDLLQVKNNIKKNAEDLVEVSIRLKEIEEVLKATEVAYNKAVIEKDEVLPLLITRKANLNQAIEITKAVELLNVERKKLREEYSKIKSGKDLIDKKIDSISTNREKANKNVEEIEQRLIEIKVEPEYREKVQNALEKESEYNQYLSRRNEIQLKEKNRRDNLKRLFREHEETLRIQEEQNTIVKELENKVEALDGNNPGDSSILLGKAEELNLYREKLDKILIDDSKRRDLETKIEQLTNNKIPIKEKLVASKEELEKRKAELTKVKAEIDHINKSNLASILASELEEGEPCPVCGSTHHLSPAKGIDRLELQEKETDRDNLEEVIEKLNEDINKLSLKIVSFEKDEEHIGRDYQLLLDGLKDIDIAKLKDIKGKKEKEFVELKEKLQKYIKEKEEIEKGLIAEREKKTKIDVRETKLNEMMKSENSILEELSSELLKENEKLNTASIEYLKLKSDLQLENVSLKMEEIKAFERETQTLGNTQKEKRRLIEAMDKEKEELSIQEKKLDIELSKILQSGTEKKKIIEEKEEEIRRLSEGENPYININVIESKIEEINKNSDLLKDKLESEKNKKQQVYDKKLSLEEAKKMLSSRLEEQNKKLLSSLKENDFNNEEEVLKVMLDEAAISKIKEEINKFEDDFKEVKGNISRIETRLNGEFIEEVKWEELKNNRIVKEKLLNLKIKEIATLQKTIDDLKRDLEELKELRKKERELEHKLSLLNDLGKLVEGNKFVEFVAMNQLKYIAKEASRRLKNITKERYALEIDSEGNFTIRDDFNGGEIRDTSTLSGGETFLTSLSLALALSSQVQLKGSAPLEFFFLDEGFGTLDTELLDLVMSSLEKLHSSRLSVGIISHVEELKNRVPVKLIVTPARPGEGGSKTTLEYS
ncbi:AAA family ATPase [Clostridium bovifaecis]|uniref:Nuclease SbcCD subunit C n=1 Tax=Clostridium bovifaecis TaxID=2184719 RepID=A0A6I6F7H5_9CLOT|nr:AAA family ATPase [Clostridium bovifaecis]